MEVVECVGDRHAFTYLLSSLSLSSSSYASVSSPPYIYSSLSLLSLSFTFPMPFHAMPSPCPSICSLTGSTHHAHMHGFRARGVLPAAAFGLSIVDNSSADCRRAPATAFAAALPPPPFFYLPPPTLLFALRGGDHRARRGGEGGRGRTKRTLNALPYPAALPYYLFVAAGDDVRWTMTPYAYTVPSVTGGVALAADDARAKTRATPRRHSALYI